jgi:hypothetical protein
MKSLGRLLLCTCLLGVGCSRTPQVTPQTAAVSPAPAPPAKNFDVQVPPSGKEIIRALLANQDVSLAVDSSCSGVGTDSRDTNIGDYISGFLAEQTNKKGKNWLDVSARPGTPAGTEPMWQCAVVIRHVDGEDRWGWGVTFLMKARDHTVARNSVRCTGSG